MSIHLENLRFSLRLIRSRPSTALLAVSCLALGIGLFTTVFSVSWSIVGRGLPYPDADRIVVIQRLEELGDDRRSESIEVADMRDIRENQSSMDTLSVFAGDLVTVGRSGDPRRINGGYVTPEFFRIFRDQPFLGRFFVPEDGRPESRPAIILTHHVWRDQFGADPDIVDQTVIFEGLPYTVVGVAPPKYKYPFNSDVYVPLIPETIQQTTGWITSGLLIGRLAEGATVDGAQDEYNTIFHRLDEKNGNTERQFVPAKVQTFQELVAGPELIGLTGIMTVSTILVLVIACSNVANLLMARMSERTQELSIRVALGATRRMILVQVLTETLLWAVLGNVIGIVGAWFAVDLLWNIADSARFSPPSWMQFRIDGTVLVISVGATIFAALIAGLFPALRASRMEVSEMLKDQTRTASSLHMGRFTRFSAISQIAFSFALLVIAGRMIVGIVYLTSYEFPFRHEDVLVAQVGIDEKIATTDEEKAEFWKRMQSELGAIPGVEKVGMGFNLAGVFGMSGRIKFPGETYATEDDYPRSRFDIVMPGYFDALGVEILAGRDFAETDTRDTEPVAIVNTLFAERFWPGEEPIGQYISNVDHGGDLDDKPLRVIGVVPSMNMAGFNPEDDASGFYRSQIQAIWGDMRVYLHGDREPEAFIEPVRKQVAAINPNLPITDMKPFRAQLSDVLFFFRFFLGLFTAFGVLALFLAAVGMFGIIQFSVSQRRMEFGVRQAFGASRSSIFRLVMGRGMVQTAIGLAIGALIAYGGSRVLLAVFDGMQEEPFSYVAALGVILLSNALANFFPARQASRLSPMEALREA